MVIAWGMIVDAGAPYGRQTRKLNISLVKR